MLLAGRCGACGRTGPSPCAACAGELRPAPALPPPPGVDRCWALLAYEGVGRELVAQLKYRNNRTALPGLARAAASLVDSPVDVVTWAPTTADRRRHRGFDQAELLARVVAAELRCPVRRLLRRPAGAAPHTGQGRAARWAGPGFAMAGMVGGRVLVVDDVVTSGATASAAARSLRTGGAGWIGVLALSRTPSRAARTVTNGGYATSTPS